MTRVLIFATLLLSLGWGSMASAQTAITRTQLATAITTPAPTTKTFTVDSATGIAVNSILYIEGETFRVTAVSGTDITAITSARPATHLVDAVVFVVPSGAQIGIDPVGSCIRGTTGTFPAYSPYTLMFNLNTGNIAYCSGALGSRVWVVVNPFAAQLSKDPPLTP